MLVVCLQQTLFLAPMVDDLYLVILTSKWIDKGFLHVPAGAVSLTSSLSLRW